LPASIFVKIHTILNAKELFEKCLEKNQNDLPAQKYLERCNLFLEKGIHKAASELSQHRKYVTTFSGLKNEVVEDRLAKTYLMFRIQIFLIDWLVNHTMKEDMHFGRFLKHHKRLA